MKTAMTFKLLRTAEKHSKSYARSKERALPLYFSKEHIDNILNLVEDAYLNGALNGFHLASATLSNLIEEAKTELLNGQETFLTKDEGIEK